MFLGVLSVLCVLSVPLFGGRLSTLAHLRLRGVGLIAGALAVQVVIISVLPGGDPGVHRAVHLSTYGLAAVFAALNRRVAGLALAALGGLLNLAAIAVNGGVMPASAHALRVAGFSQAATHFRNSGAVADAHLQVLGDVFALPASWPVHNVFSIGDVLLVLGLLVSLHVVCGSAPARRLGLHPVTVEAVEVVETGSDPALVRVTLVAHRGIPGGDLVVGTPVAERRLSPLPGSARVLSYAVPQALLADDGIGLALALPNRARLALPVPARDSR